jgi:hypothetical protein
MAFATITRYDEATWQYVEPKALQHGDLVARITASGQPGQERVVLKADGKPPALLGYPKRMTPVEGDGALLGNYVDDGRILVVGHVTPPETKAKPSNGKAKASQPKAAKPSVSRSQDTTSRNVGTPKASTSSDTPHEATESNGPSGRMTKATAADALDAIAEAIAAQGEALKMVAAALR